MNIDVAFEALWNLAIFRYGGFEFKAVSDKWLHDTDEVEEEYTKSRKQTLTRQQLFKKGCVYIAEAAHTVGALLVKKVFCGLRLRTTSADVNKIKVPECHSVPLL